VSYIPKNTGNFDLSKSTLFVYVCWYVCVNRRACVVSRSEDDDFCGFEDED
jgi:hypothetical protein